MHRGYYPTGHFTKELPVPLLIKYYGEFIENNKCYSYSCRASNGGALLGFIIAGEQLGVGIGNFKRNNRINLFKTALANPKAFIKVLIERVNNFFAPSVPFSEDKILILSIVSNGLQKGIGVALIEHIKKEINGKTNKLGLYVRAANIKAVNFYLKCHFHIIGYVNGQYYMESTVGESK